MDFKPKLMAFDLDGTLAESKQRLSAEMGELLARLAHKMPIAILSGAGLPQFEKQFLTALPDSANLAHVYLFPDNAAQCFVFKDGAWSAQYDYHFSTEEKTQILTALKDSLAEVAFETPPHLWGEQIEDRGAEIVFSALGQEAPIEEKKKYDPTREKRKPLYDALVQKLPQFSIGLNAATSIDITRKGINKAYGILELVKFSGISVSEILYVGDALEEGGNDSVVIPTGVKTHEVFGPQETAKLIEDILAQKNL